MRCISIIFVCFALIRVAGLDLAVIQMQVWGEMVYERSEQGVMQAVYTTLSGESPCEKCNQLEEQRGKQKNNDFCLGSLDKLKLPLEPVRSKEPKTHNVVAEAQGRTPYLFFSVEVHLGIETPPPRV